MEVVGRALRVVEILAVGAVALALVSALAVSAPDIVRYFKIRQM